MGSIYELIISICNYIQDNDIQLLNWQFYGLGVLLRNLGMGRPGWVMGKLKRDLLEADS